MVAVARWESSVGVRLVLRAEALEHGHERAEVLEAGDRDAHRRHHLAAEEVGGVGVVDVDGEAVLLERRLVDARVAAAAHLQSVALELLAVREVVLVALEGKELERAGRDLELRGARAVYGERQRRLGGAREPRRRGAAWCDVGCAARRRRGAWRTIFKKNATPASCSPKALTSSHEFVTSDTLSAVTMSERAAEAAAARRQSADTRRSALIRDGTLWSITISNPDL